MNTYRRFVLPHITWAVYLYISVILAFSAIPHILKPYRFLALVYSYPVFGGPIAIFVAAVVPLLSLTVSISLVFGWMRYGSLAISTMLSSGFSSLHLFGMLPESSSCGCIEGPLGDWVGTSAPYIAYSLLFATVAGLLLESKSTRLDPGNTE